MPRCKRSPSDLVLLLLYICRAWFCLVQEFEEVQVNGMPITNDYDCPLLNLTSSVSTISPLAISQLHASESIHGMYDITSGCSIAATLSIAVNGEIGRWAFEMCA